MTSDGVQATRAAVDAVGSAVRTFAQRARQIDEDAAASATRFEGQVSQEHSRRVEELHRARASREAAEAALRACTENCGGLERALATAVGEEDRARRRADASAKAVAQVGEGIRDFEGGRRSMARVLEEHAPRAAASTQRLSDDIENYRGSGTTGNVSGKSGGGQRNSESPSTLAGRESIKVGDVIDDTGKSPSFEKVSREQVEWGLDRLKGVVEPALRNGKGADYFASRDAAEGLSGERSYSGVYNWFYNSDHAIKVTRATGGYVVTNGYHRLAVTAS